MSSDVRPGVALALGMQSPWAASLKGGKIKDDRGKIGVMRMEQAFGCSGKPVR